MKSGRSNLYCLALLLASCGGGDSPQSTLGPVLGEVSVSPTPTPSPTPSSTSGEPTKTTQSSGGGTTQVELVDSGLNVESLLGPKSIPPSNEPDVVGAFRFLCGPGQLNYDDPVVYPGQPGKAHLHQYFGNLEANAHSTYESLRKSGESTCMNELNRSAYWMPALLDGKGNVVRPNFVSVYYKRRPASDPWWQQAKATPKVLPRGLRYIFGWDQFRPNETQDIAQWKCVDVWTPVPGSSGTLDTALANCQPGQKLYVSLNSELCWDGRLDSSDHRSHMAGMIRDASTNYVSQCPSTHPYALPQFTMTVEWTIGEGDNTSLWHLSSDHMLPPGSPRGGSMHSDWFGAWEDEIMQRWHDGCIDQMLNCSDGDLGDGQIMKRNEHYPKAQASPRLVPVPPRVS